VTLHFEVNALPYKIHEELCDWAEGKDWSLGSSRRPEHARVVWAIRPQKMCHPEYILVFIHFPSLPVVITSY
jgi:hypothetical protein